MKFKKLEFEDKNAQRVYDNYMKDLRNGLKPILDADRQEVLMEFNSHIHEHLQNNKSQPELHELLNAIERLGTIQEILAPLLADKLLERATKSFNPVHVFKALLYNIGNGFSHIIFALLYLSLGSFIFLIGAKLFNSDHVGLYFKDDEFQAVGLIQETADYQEVLGHWFIPLMLLATILLYFGITLLLKLKKSLTQQ